MEPMSFIEKITTVFQLILSNSMSILACILVIAFGVGLFYMKRLPLDKQKKMIGIVYGVIITVVVLRFANPILILLNHLMQQFALVFYFPDIVVYVLLFLIANIILVRNLVKEEIDSKKKGINIIGFTCFLLLFVIGMKEIMTNGIDVYTVKELYQNQTVIASLQLSTIVFFSWMVISGLYSIYQHLMNAEPVPVSITEKIVERKPVINYRKKQEATPEIANPYFNGFEPLLQKVEKKTHPRGKKQPAIEPIIEQPISQSVTIETPQPMIREEKTTKRNEELLMQNIQAMIKGNDPKLTLDEYRRMRGMLIKNTHQNYSHEK